MQRAIHKKIYSLLARDMAQQELIQSMPNDGSKRLMARIINGVCCMIDKAKCQSMDGRMDFAGSKGE